MEMGRVIEDTECSQSLRVPKFMSRGSITTHFVHSFRKGVYQSLCLPRLKSLIRSTTYHRSPGTTGVVQPHIGVRIIEYQYLPTTVRSVV